MVEGCQRTVEAISFHEREEDLESLVIILHTSLDVSVPGIFKLGLQQEFWALFISTFD